MRFLSFLGALFALILAGGCGTKEDAKATTQVAARVNDEEITVHQVNYLLSRKQNLPPEEVAQAKREILSKLIDQQLAKQKAVESELDRSPEVVQAIEAAKTEILARIYLERLAEAVPMTADWEAKKYYSEHPELFSQRRLFNLEEFVFSTKGDEVAALRNQLPKMSSMKEIANWLQSRGIGAVADRGVRAAEQIPFAMLPRLHAMKEGDIALFDGSEGRSHIVRLAGFKIAPVDEATAIPRIRQFLFNQRLTEYLSKEMKRLRDQARIEYFGEFAGSDSAGNTEGNPQPEGGAKPGQAVDAAPAQ